MMNGLGGHGWGMGFGWIIGLIILVAIVWFIMKTVNQNSRTLNSGNKSDMDILKERYASGEIDKAEFDEKKKDLV